jgi:hypothetical protein
MELQNNYSNVYYIFAYCTQEKANFAYTLNYRHAQENGIWAFDAKDKDLVLVIPFVLAFLGDNPMQSEIACHIGLKGKFFCRSCWVKGHDVAGEDENKINSTTDLAQQDTMSANNSNSDSEHSTRSVQKNKRSRREETMHELVERAKRFLGVRIQSCCYFLILINYSL